MSLIDFIGFVIVMIAMIFLYTKKIFEERKRKRHPELYQSKEDEQDVLKELLSALKIEQKNEQSKKPVQPSPSFNEEESYDEFEEQIKLEKLKMRGSQRKIFHSPGEKTAYLLSKKKRLTSNLYKKSKVKDGIIYKEILGKPKGYDNF